MAPSVLVCIAEGTEEIEAVSAINILRRADVHVSVTSVGSDKKVVCSRGVIIMAECTIDEVKNNTYDCIVLPGGTKGAESLRDCKVLAGMLKDQKTNKKWIAAICASPSIVLQSLGLLEGETAVCYPALMDTITNKGCGRVHVSNKIVTSVGPSASLEFALKLIELLVDKAKADRVKEDIVL